MKIIEAEKVIIIGSGLAALMVADRLSEHKNVIVLTKSKIHHSNSVKAQGGVAAVVSRQDSWKNHYEDTLLAGCDFNDKEAVELLVKQGPEYLTRLMEAGLQLDRDASGNLLLGQEGAHSERRILHAGGDATGKAIMEFLTNRLHSKVKVIEEEAALDLLMEGNECVGVLTGKENGRLKTYDSRHVVLATGGCGGLFQVTSNDPSVTGNGIALAYRAGAEVTDLEFIQFHPTMLYHQGHCFGLVSEAVRGEGAVLVNDREEKIMERVHTLHDLAPRDVVAREIQSQQNQGRRVFLDISMINDFTKKFPTVTSICERAGIDVETGRLPVAPGAHFLMGGIKTNLSGETTVKGLYAVGEAACTGVHGANRLASNSLLEGIVFANLLADKVLAKPVRYNWHKKYDIARKPERHLSLPAKEEIRQVMSRYAGIERHASGLSLARQWLESFDWQPGAPLDVSCYSKEQIECINELTTSWLIVTSALQRTESRGGHFRTDFPIVNNTEWKNRHITHAIEDQKVHQPPATGAMI